MKTLVVYYSRKGYVQEVALQRAEECNADFLELDVVDDTVGYDGFFRCGKAASSSKEMVLLPYDTEVSDYEKVIICSPVWMGDISVPIKEFIMRERHNIKNAEYIFVHYMPGKFEKLADDADKMLRLKREKFTSIQCVWGHFLSEQTFPEQENTDEQNI